MALKLSGLIKTTVKVADPYHITWLFRRPSALDLIKIQSTTSQLYAASQASTTTEGAPAPSYLEDLIRFQVELIATYCCEATGFLDDKNKVCTVTDPDQLKELIEHIPLQLISMTFNSFLESLYASADEKKS
jgi:hypothetical protein